MLIALKFTCNIDIRLALDLPSITYTSQHKTELKSSTSERKVPRTFPMRQHRKEKQAAPHPTWLTKGHSLVLQKQRWLWAPHTTKATHQDRYRTETLCRRGVRGPWDNPHIRKRPLRTLKFSPLTWYNLTGSSQKSQQREWLSPVNGELGLGEHSSPSDADNKASNSPLQMEVLTYHQNGFCQKTLHELTVAFAVYASNNLNGFV